MTFREFMQWFARHLVSPLDDERRFDLGHAMTRRLLVQIHTKHGSKHPLQDFLPFHPKPDINEAERAFLRWAQQYGKPGNA